MLPRRLISIRLFGLPVDTEQLAKYVRLVLGAVLLVAASSKIFAGGGDNIALVGDRPVLVFAIVLVEAAMGGWLVTGIAPKCASACGSALFFILGCAAASLVATGTPTCGCFGKFETRPELMAILDIVASATLYAAFWTTRESKAFDGEPISISSMRDLLFVVVAVLSVTCITSLRPELAAGTRVPPDTWIGQPVKVLAERDFVAQLSKRTWLVVLYRPDCAACHDAITSLCRLVDDHPQLALPIAFLRLRDKHTARMPDHVQRAMQAHPNGLAQLTVSDSIVTPAMVRVRDGIVEEVWVGKRAMQMVDLLASRRSSSQ